MNMSAGGKVEKIVLDLETKKGFEQVEKGRLDLLGISVAGIYSYQEERFRSFLEKDLQQLVPYLQKAQLVVGFNIINFDFPVLQPYINLELSKLKSLDILAEVYGKLGFRLGLNSIAMSTLNIGKSGNGLDALKFFRQGRMKELIEYCQQDVRVTRELYEYGRTHGHLLYRRGLRLETIPANWAECKTVEQILAEAFQGRRTLEIAYASVNSQDAGQLLREVDIYDFDLGRITAFCHLRQQLRTFNVRRILSAKITENRYEIPSDFNLQEFKAKSKFV